MQRSSRQTVFNLSRAAASHPRGEATDLKFASFISPYHPVSSVLPRATQLLFQLESEKVSEHFLKSWLGVIWQSSHKNPERVTGVYVILTSHCFLFEPGCGQLGPVLLLVRLYFKGPRCHFQGTLITIGHVFREAWKCGHRPAWRQILAPPPIRKEPQTIGLTCLTVSFSTCKVRL